MLDMQKRLSNSFFAIIGLPSTAMGFSLCIQISLEGEARTRGFTWMQTVSGFVLNRSADKGVLFVICGTCLAVSGVLWMFVSEKQQAGAAAPAFAASH